MVSVTTYQGPGPGLGLGLAFSVLVYAGGVMVMQALELAFSVLVTIGFKAPARCGVALSASFVVLPLGQLEQGQGQA